MRIAYMIPLAVLGLFVALVGGAALYQSPMIGWTGAWLSQAAAPLLALWHSYYGGILFLAAVLFVLWFLRDSINPKSSSDIADHVYEATRTGQRPPKGFLLERGGGWLERAMPQVVSTLADDLVALEERLAETEKRLDKHKVRLLEHGDTDKIFQEFMAETRDAIKSLFLVSNELMAGRPQEKTVEVDAPGPAARESAARIGEAMNRARAEARQSVFGTIDPDGTRRPDMRFLDFKSLDPSNGSVV